MLRKFQARAQLACAAHPTPYLTKQVTWPDSPVELFFDIETDPMRDLCYLHGFIIRENRDARSERFAGIYAAGITPASERDAFAAAMTIFRQYPTAAVIHYSKYERTEYRKLQRKYPDVASAQEIEALYTRPRALDLYLDVVKPGSEWPTLDFSIKSLAKYCGFSWRDADPSGASPIEWFDQWVRTGNPDLKQRLLDYNEDDCVAMRVVLDAMNGFEVRGYATWVTHTSTCLRIGTRYSGRRCRENRPCWMHVFIIGILPLRRMVRSLAQQLDSNESTAEPI